MNVKKGLMASLLAISLLPIQCISVQAVETYDSPTELLTAMVEQSLIDIASDTKNDAITTMRSKISTNGDEVFYDGQSIGYWFSDDSAYLYKDSEKSSKNIGLNWEVSPSLLSLVLTDVNEELVDTVVPTSSDWSKIIGKYDVTLGDVTIPADQWLDMSIQDEVFSRDGVVDITTMFDKTGADFDSLAGHGGALISAYAIDKSGNLWLQNGAYSLSVFGNAYNVDGVLLSGKAQQFNMAKKYEYDHAPTCSGKNYPKIRVMLVKHETSSGKYGLEAQVIATDAVGSVYWHSVPYRSYDGSCFAPTADYMHYYKLYKVGGNSAEYSGDTSDFVKRGIYIIRGSDICPIQTPAIQTMRLKFFDKQSSSRKTIGNQVLRRRINALNSLLPTDTVTLTADGWTVNGLSSIDTYISDQSLSNAGDTADIPAVADIDALQFNVILPTSLPVYVDAANVTYVADNANIVNKSGAPVQLTEVTIEPEADSGWTFVSGKPSPNIGDNEFNFSTTIEKAKVLNINETYPFTYMANLSPTTESSTSLELAKVMVTVDWATTGG